MADPQQVPVRIRIHLAHATVQTIADRVGADILHIKGPAADPSLRPKRKSSVDADVLVRPDHLSRFLAGLTANGWTQMTMMRSGGLVEHSTNWFHPQLGQMDVHIRFPGIQIAAGVAFSELWRGRASIQLAHQTVTVPRLTAQRLILLLHAARGLASHSDDVMHAWTAASVEERTQVTALASTLRADVALAAATGRLDEYRDRPEYALWRLYVDGTITKAGFTRVRAEIKAAPDGISLPRLRVVRYVLFALLRMDRRVSNLTGTKGSPRDVLRAYATFFKRGRDAFKRENERP